MAVGEGLLIAVAVALDGVSSIGVEGGVESVDASSEGRRCEARSASPVSREHGLAERGDPSIEAGLDEGTGRRDWCDGVQ